ncbi:MAG: ComF family protein [Deltaproteobacteria bacterium]|jgi:ComF family protein|nr:ComF family protein [Deltaproteobacteria bacterium]
MADRQNIKLRFWRFAAVIGNSLAAIISEKRCGICAAPIRRPNPNLKLGLCRKCLDAMPRRKAGYCLRCGEFVSADEMPYGLCGNCLLSPPPWQKIYFHGAYQGLLRESISRLKFGQVLHLAEALGGLLAAHPELAVPSPPPTTTGDSSPINNFAPRPDDAPYSCIIPVPLHKKRLTERGFNQSALLAAPLARTLSLPLELKLLSRSRDTAHQTGLSREVRRHNMLEAFTVTGRADGLRILLFDDVLTTGATLASAAACLLRAGAERVDVAVLARTPLG